MSEWDDDSLRCLICHGCCDLVNGLALCENCACREHVIRLPDGDVQDVFHAVFKKAVEIGSRDMRDKWAVTEVSTSFRNREPWDTGWGEVLDRMILVVKRVRERDKGPARPTMGNRRRDQSKIVVKFEEGRATLYGSPGSGF